MKHFAQLLALGMGLALLSGCSQEKTSAPGYESNPISASAIRLVDTSLLTVKAARTDDGQGYTDEFSHNFVVDDGQGIGFEDGFLDFSANGDAVSNDVAIEAQWMGSGGFYGYDFGPDGLQFDNGVELGYEVGGILASGLLNEGETLVLYWDLENGSFVEIPSELVIENGKAELKATIHHFTKYVIGIGPPPGGGTDD